MTLLHRFQKFIDEQRLFMPGDKLVLAVSGGVDSIVLFELCRQAGFDFSIAHCNFRLRTEESERDETFVRSLAERHGKTLRVKSFDTSSYAAGKKISTQTAARELRYEWFHSLTKDSGNDNGGYHASVAKYILTAHHLDDNIETITMNFFRGTGIAGLRGMLPKQDDLIRPLLFAEKEELLQFAVAHQLQWSEDSSNGSDKYTRNYFRHQVLPLLEKVYPGTSHNLAGNISRFGDIETLYLQAVEAHKKGLLEYRGHEIHIPVLKLKRSKPLTTIVFEIIRPYHFSAGQVTDVIRLLDSESGKYVLSSTHRILKNRKWLIISSSQDNSSAHVIIEEQQDTVYFENGRISLTKIAGAGHDVPAGEHIAALDATNIQFPLLLRKWKKGDYFYPLGMRKKKKVNRFLIDRKLSQNDKEKVWVLEMNKTIIWVVGQRIDDRFKITPQTKSRLHIEMRMA